jgi:hypothetical protein
MANLLKEERNLRANMEAEEKSAQRPRGIRESLYSHIKVSVRTMNIIILFISLLLIASIVIGVAQGGR